MLVRVFLAIRTRRVQRRIARLVFGPDTIVAEAGARENFWERLATETFDIVVVDRDALSQPETEAISAIRQLPDEPEVVVVWDREDAEARALLLSAGCVAIINTGLADDVVSESFSAIIERRQHAAVQVLRAQQVRAQPRLGDFISSSPAMQRLMAIAQRVATSDTSLLILGETGVGKEWLARGIHAEGPRSPEPFIAVNCAAIVETLLESELFGHEEGAFTGAKRAHRGRFEMAHGGTMFLDEIGEMPLHLQVKILRVLQERKIQRVGSEKEIEIDVRLIAATNKNLEHEVQEGRFRSDLYYRIGVVTLTVPPLSERREDIPDLIQNYLEVYQVRLGRQLEGIEEEAMQGLVEYAWPGNVRELINVMERAVLLCDGPWLTLDGLPAAIAGRASSGANPRPGTGTDENLEGVSRWADKPLGIARQELLREFERSYLCALLKETDGRIGITAHRAGITPRALSAKMRKHNLRKEDFREHLQGL